MCMVDESAVPGAWTTSGLPIKGGASSYVESAADRVNLYHMCECLGYVPFLGGSCPAHVVVVY